MRVTDKYDVYDRYDERSIYTVELDDGRGVDVMRKHYPGFNERTPLVYVMEPHDPDINEEDIINFLRETCEDFMMPVFERKRKYAYQAVVDTCYSVEQAVYLADKMWQESKKKSWELFQIRNGGKVIKDYIADALERKAGAINYG